MSEEKKDLKAQFGKLGLYLVNKAQEEIRDLNQLILFQKAKIKKDFIERISERSMKLRSQFIEKYNQFLNKILSDTLLNVKNDTLTLKNKMIKDLKKDSILQLQNYVQKNNETYIKYIVKTIQKNIKIIDKPPRIEMYFSSRDYDYFQNHKEELENLFQNEVGLRKDEGFIGGFKIIQTNTNMVYDYTLDNLIEKNQTLLQMEFSKIISEEKLSQLEVEFENYIHSQKKAISEYLKQYDKI